MPDEDAHPRTLLLLFALPMSILLAGQILDYALNDTTTLFPAHSWDNLPVWMGAIGAALGIPWALLLTRGANPWQRIVPFILGPFLGFLVVFLTAMTLLKLWNDHLDFPRGKTHIMPGMVPLSRAYATHGKGDHYDIQTMPYWSNMSVEQADFDFMRRHRAPGDLKGGKDEISSRGYFCAKVTVELASDVRGRTSAVRILHAGSRTLPRGTVVICPGNLHTGPPALANGSPATP